jgi:4'-phosphopantetheinyl transferase
LTYSLYYAKIRKKQTIGFCKLKKILIGKMPPNYEEELAEKLKMLSPQRAEYLSWRKIKDDFAVSVYASAAAAELAGEYLCKKTTDIIFDRDENGKPFIKDSDDINLSISHSYPFYAEAISDKPIGIDIEKIRDVNPNIAKRAFTENEREYTGSSKERFFEIWTKKEAYAKFTGNGLAEGFRSFDVLLPPIADNLTFEIKNEAAIAIYIEEN